MRRARESFARSFSMGRYSAPIRPAQSARMRSARSSSTIERVELIPYLATFKGVSTEKAVPITGM